MMLSTEFVLEAFLSTGKLKTTRYRYAKLENSLGLLFCLCLLQLFLCGGARSVVANAAGPESTRVDTASSSKGWKSLRPKLSAWGLVYLPKVYYTTERGFGVGGQIIRPFRWPNGEASLDRSDVRLKGRITTKGQSEVESVLNLKWGQGRYYLRSKVNFNNLALRYYGIGPDTPDSNEEVYQPQQVRAYVEFYRRFFSHLKIGVRYEFEHFKFLEVEPNRLLDTDRIRATVDKNTVGAGILLDWDTRDRKHSPTSGSYYQAFAIFFDDELGSEHDFNNYHIDLKNYFSAAPGHVLASQFFVYAAKGSPPFWRMAALGGRAHSRGYRKGRYLDRVLFAFQGEYRAQVWWRFGLVGFAGVACVTRTLRRLEFGLMRPTVGGGIRFRTGLEDRIRARLDIAAGENTVRVYLSLDEAF
ncbi:MAG: BamA/TamA family outer membrane protein [Candidatus Latescibacteria bacterium]|nr:BamA/TamA family outer membrane protein [Candidatus Latescibacterota bacterium]NIO57247.1 BamA/TamA family outer membrane protein [Candidatus Latescibacterota bacterium]